MTRIDAEPHAVAVDIAEQAVIAAARRHADRMRITPRWQERLTPEARQLVEAVLTLDAAEATR